MVRYVVDASVVVKWFLKEAYSVEARRLRDDYAADLVDLDAPAVLPFEVLNAVRFSDGSRPGEFKRVARVLDGFGLPLHHLEGPLSAVATDLAASTGLTVYDASYLALAQVLASPLCTADDELVRVSRDTEATFHVRQYRSPPETGNP